MKYNYKFNRVEEPTNFLGGNIKWRQIGKWFGQQRCTSTRWLGGLNNFWKYSWDYGTFLWLNIVIKKVMIHYCLTTLRFPKKKFLLDEHLVATSGCFCMNYAIAVMAKYVCSSKKELLKATYWSGSALVRRQELMWTQANPNFMDN